MKLINNQDQTLIQELKAILAPASEVYIATGYLTIPALFELTNELLSVKSINILVDDDIESDVRFSYDSKEFNSYFDLKSKYKADSVIKLIRDKSQVRYGSAGAQKFILVKNADTIHCFSFVPQDFNTITLGIQFSPRPIILIYFEDNEGQYLNLFEKFWSNSSRDLKSNLLQAIERAAIHNSPEVMYKYTLFNLFHNTQINEENEQRINNIGFKQTEIWKMLFNFQKDAVLGAIDKIETYGGCIIADSVGLGKTFEALAIMKYYQMRNDRILVLCPKKLRDNWLVYTQNDIRNILTHDRLNYDVLNHTDLSRKSGESGYINLETINWGNYDLVVIDESHSFRNNNPKRDGITRYQRLMNDIIKSGVKTKVLMLSATPVNTRMNDIKNQIAFITEQNDTALAPYGINSIEQTLRKAQAKFNAWLKETNGGANSRESLIDGLDGSYFKLLDLLTIARSRKHIEKYYDVSDIGKFPERLTPINRYADFDRNGSFQSMDRVNDELNALNLGFYSPLSYVRDNKRKSYEDKYDIETSTGSIFKQIERESSLIHLMRVNLLKRLESSIYSFRLTLKALLRQINTQLSKIESANRPDFFDEELDINAIDTDDEVLEDLLTGGKIKVLLQDMDMVRCKEDLLDDKKRLENLLNQSSVIDVSRDSKLHDLKLLITEKVNNNINSGNKKVVVFSAFADTVQYLYHELNNWLREEHHLNSAMVTGGDANKTNLKGCKADLTSILTNFSPLSKKRDIIFPDATEQIDILFCTDCISEGQNLQDCDYLVNYDIHWNPVRIVQRFGRIDRIGSVNDKIQLVNFFPNLALDTYIDLIGRVKGRMQILDVSATGDDNIIEETSAQHHDLEYRKRQLKQLQNKVIDLEDIEGGISITDLTFNDFKIDVERLTPEERAIFALTPKSIFALTDSNLEEAPRGVIFCIKDCNGEASAADKGSATYPYSLCYVNEQGEIFVAANNPKRCLDYYKKLCLGKHQSIKPLTDSFDKETQGGKNMDKYTSLLQTAMSHIKGVEDEMGIDTLAFPGGTNISRDMAKEAFEIISYLVVR
jgi:SNF2 family DNA or RNA helicase